MAYTMQFGGQQVGTELIYNLPAGERLTPPVEDEGVDRDTALLVEAGQNIIWRPRFVIFHEETDMFLFSAWLIAVVRMLRATRAEAKVYDDGVLQLTYPACSFVGFNRPQPRSVAEARFAAEVAFDFVTDEDPY